MLSRQTGNKEASLNYEEPLLSCKVYSPVAYT